MLDLIESTRTSPHFNRLEIGDFLFAEYTCPIEVKTLDIWARMDYLVHVISGKKTWHTTHGSWTAEAGQTLYFKKGAAIIEQFFEHDFCLLIFFIPDDFIRDIVREYGAELNDASAPDGMPQPAIRVEHDTALSVFFNSMKAYFSSPEKPSEPLLKLKVKELIVGILASRNNRQLASYFRSLAYQTAPQLNQIMEANFRYNLSLENFARLCNRSLSSFKRDFREHYKEPPGKWLLRRRLEYSAALLRGSDMNVSQIALESGFEDLSHFSRSFREMFGMPPTTFRNQAGRRAAGSTL